MFRVRVFFNFDDVQSLEEALKICYRSYLILVLFRTECCVQRRAHVREREGKKALSLGFIFIPQTRYIQFFDKGLDRSFVNAFGEKFSIFCTGTFPLKT